MEANVDLQKLDKLMSKVVGDLSAAAAAALVVVGDRTGLYRAMADGKPRSPQELAKKTGTQERYTREWLSAQAAGGYCEYDAKIGQYSLTPEQAFAFGTDSSPASVAGAFQILQAMWAGVPQMTENFKSGEGLAWGAQHTCLFEGTERFFRAGYIQNLMSSWIPALEGVQSRLERGATVADVGCGLGASTILMAKAFPKSRFFGFDSHEPSIELAGQRAREAGVGDRVSFAVAKSTEYPGQDYDLVCHFDCLHDMEDPGGAARHTRKTLKPDGTWMIVEPLASDRVEDNLNPVGRLFYSASTMICVPHSLSQRGPALGAQAGESRLRQVAVEQGGFRYFRRATQTPFNMVLEARP